LTLFLDTSALLKRYIDESGTREVIERMAEDERWVASALAEAEAHVALCHLLDDAQLKTQRRRLRQDWERFLVVPVDGLCLFEAVEIGCQQHVRTLDAIHLAAASRLPDAVRFLTFDHRQAAAARAIGLDVDDFTAPTSATPRPPTAPPDGRP